MGNRIFFVLIMGVFLVMNACSDREDGKSTSDSEFISKARNIHDRVLTLDAHIDIEVSFFTPENPDKMGYQKLASLPSMKSGGLDGAFFTAYVEQGPLDDKGFAAAHALALAKIDRIHHVAKDELSDDVGIALDPEDVSNLHRKGKIVAVIGMENGYPLGVEIANLETFFNRGVRYITL